MPPSPRRWPAAAARSRGAAKIGAAAALVLDRGKMAKRFTLTITDDSFAFTRKDDAIAAAAALDGVSVVRASLADAAILPDDAVRAYKGLSQVERAFRCLKTVDLEVRPIHHRLEERVRAHVFLGMLADSVEWRRRQSLAPILFDDHEPHAGAAARRSIVAPAQRSPAALRKVAAKRTDDHLPVQKLPLAHRRPRHLHPQHHGHGGRPQPHLPALSPAHPAPGPRLPAPRRTR